MTDDAFDPTRRDLLRAAVAGSLLSCVPFSPAEAAFTTPTLRFSGNRTRDGVVGPWGEVRVLNSGGKVLPTMVITNGGFGLLNLSVQRPYVQLGVKDDRVVFSSQGVQLRSGDPFKPWSAEAIRAIHAAIAQDRSKLRGLLELRAVLHTTFTVAATAAKGTSERRFAAALAKGSGGLGARSMQRECTTTTITDTVIRTVTEYVDVIKTAQQQYDECYAKNVRSATCSALGPGAGLCAASYCLAMGFVDLVVGFYEVTRTLAEEVVRTVVVCTAPIRGSWPNPVTLIDQISSKIGFAAPPQSFSQEDILGATRILAAIIEEIERTSEAATVGTYVRCLFGGQWSLASLPPIPMGLPAGGLSIPYGIKVCISADCANQMAATNVAQEYAQVLPLMLGVLGGLNQGVYRLLGDLGWLYGAFGTGVLIGAVGGPVAAKACAALMVAFVINALYYGGLISGQLAIHQQATNHFADGTVCIEHPCFALQFIELMTTGAAPTELVPPIVTG